MALGGKSQKAKVKRFLSQGGKRWGAKGKTAKGWRANVAEPTGHPEPKAATRENFPLLLIKKGFLIGFPLHSMWQSDSFSFPPAILQMMLIMKEIETKIRELAVSRRSKFLSITIHNSLTS